MADEKTITTPSEAQAMPIVTIPDHQHDGSSGTRINEKHLLKYREERDAPIDYFIHIDSGRVGTTGLDFAFNRDWTRLLISGSSEIIYHLKNMQGIKSDAFIMKEWKDCATKIATGDYSITYQYPYFFIVCATDQKVYRISDTDDFLSSITELTPTGDGGALSAGTAIAADNTYIYILDAANTVKKYTHNYADAQLAYVGAITLEDSDAKSTIAVDNTYIYAIKELAASTPNDYQTFCKYGFDGQLISSLAITRNEAVPAYYGLDIDPDGRLRCMIKCSTGLDSGTAADYGFTTITRINI